MPFRAAAVHCVVYSSARALYVRHRASSVASAGAVGELPTSSSTKRRYGFPSSPLATAGVGEDDEPDLGEVALEAEEEEEDSDLPLPAVLKRSDLGGGPALAPGDFGGDGGAAAG